MPAPGTGYQMISIASKPIVVVGGGLSGLAAAYRLHQAGLPVQLIEARSRLGGRILSLGEDGQPSDDGLDLGPSWFWPDITPEILPLVHELGLSFFPQYSDGLILVQRSRGKMSERYTAFRQEPASMRLAGGTGALISALANRLPQDCVRPGTRATSIDRSPTEVTITLATDTGAVETADASHVIFALPPRLLERTVDFVPPPPQSIREMWRATPTWMAPHAKFFALYERPFWRNAGLSGAAQSMVGPLVEIHDATTASGKAALFGFVGVAAQNRMQMGQDAIIAASLNQLGEIFGLQALNPIATLYKDWAADNLTATPLDLASPGHPAGSDRDWIDAGWSRWVTLAGSETSPAFPGYLAGAIEAGEKVAAKLVDQFSAAVLADTKGYQP